MMMALVCQLKPATAAGKTHAFPEVFSLHTQTHCQHCFFSHSRRAARSFREINTEECFKAEKRALKTHMNLYKQSLNQIKQNLHLKAFL